MRAGRDHGNRGREGREGRRRERPLRQDGGEARHPASAAGERWVMCGLGQSSPSAGGMADGQCLALRLSAGSRETPLSSRSSL